MRIHKVVSRVPFILCIAYSLHLHFQTWLDLGSVLVPLNYIVLLSLYWNVYMYSCKLQKFNFSTSLPIDHLLTTATLWKGEIIWRMISQVLYSLYVLTFRYETYKSIIGHFFAYSHTPSSYSIRYQIMPISLLASPIPFVLFPFCLVSWLICF